MSDETVKTTESKSSYSSDGDSVKTKEVQTEKKDHDRGIELHGAISGLDATAKTFVLRSVTVSYASTVMYQGVVEADLAGPKAAKVEVKGPMSADGTTLNAMLIKFETD